MVFLKEFLKKVDFEKNQQTIKTGIKIPSMQRVYRFQFDPSCQ